MDPTGADEDPLQAALATAFADSPIPHRPSVPAPPETATTDPPKSPTPPVSLTESEKDKTEDAWKEQYDQLLAGWRAESAAARQKAEHERERWRLIREQEEQERKTETPDYHHPHDSKEAEWETIERARKSKDAEIVSLTSDDHDTASSLAGQGLSVAKEAAAAVHDVPPPSHGSPSPADVRDLVTGEVPRNIESFPLLPDTTSRHPFHIDASVSTTTAPPSTADDHALTGSRTWEQVPSLESSFPSISFHDRSMAPSPEPRHPSSRQLQQLQYPPPSVTLAIFDSSLSARTRIWALASSLAINLFLPFVNGMMLGFGEIFARNFIIDYLGWNIPSWAPGLRAVPKRRRD